MRAVGEMPEWPNGTDSKSVVPSPVPRVRIPISPPYLYLKAPFYGAFLLSVVSVPPFVPPLYFCVILLCCPLKGCECSGVSAWHKKTHQVVWRVRSSYL